MLNIEKYKDEIKNYIENGDDLQDGLCSIYHNTNHHGTNYQGVLNWLCSEYKEPILDEEEKAYLSAIIKPFRDRTVCIGKHQSLYHPTKYNLLEIAVKPLDNSNNWDYIHLPIFSKKTMYRNMALGKKYTLEELGL